MTPADPDADIRVCLRAYATKAFPARMPANLATLRHDERSEVNEKVSLAVRGARSAGKQSAQTGRGALDPAA